MTENLLCDQCMIIVRSPKIMDSGKYCPSCLELLQDVDDDEADRWRDPVLVGEVHVPEE
jgi:uncharacterized paraquat-inducible protein A